MCTAAMISLLVRQTVEEELKNKTQHYLGGLSTFVCTSKYVQNIHSFIYKKEE